MTAVLLVLLPALQAQKVLVIVVFQALLCPI